MSPLTKEEQKWIRKMDRILCEMPARLLMVESGDALFVVDRNEAEKIDIHDGNCRRQGIVLADLPNGTFKVQGTTG